MKTVLQVHTQDGWTITAPPSSNASQREIIAHSPNGEEYTIQMNDCVHRWGTHGVVVQLFHGKQEILGTDTYYHDPFPSFRCALKWAISLTKKYDAATNQSKEE